MSKSYNFDTIKSTAVKEAVTTYGINRAQMASLLGISEKTYYNMMKSATLDKNQGDRFTFISNILEEGQITFNGHSNFKGWLNSEQPTLGGITPIEMMSTINGAQEVQAAITRIKHGIFA